MPHPATKDHFDAFTKFMVRALEHVEHGDIDSFAIIHKRDPSDPKHLIMQVVGFKGEFGFDFEPDCPCHLEKMFAECLKLVTDTCIQGRIQDRLLSEQGQVFRTDPKRHTRKQ